MTTTATQVEQTDTEPAAQEPALQCTLVQAAPGALVFVAPGLPPNHPLARRTAGRPGGQWAPARSVDAPKPGATDHPGANYARLIGRVGLLAAALGLGAAVVGQPGVAVARPSTDSGSTSTSDSTSDSTPSKSDSGSRTTDRESSTSSTRNGARRTGTMLRGPGRGRTATADDDTAAGPASPHARGRRSRDFDDKAGGSAESSAPTGSVADTSPAPSVESPVTEPPQQVEPQPTADRPAVESTLDDAATAEPPAAPVTEDQTPVVEPPSAPGETTAPPEATAPTEPTPPSETAPTETAASSGHTGSSAPADRLDITVPAPTATTPVEATTPTLHIPSALPEAEPHTTNGQAIPATATTTVVTPTEEPADAPATPFSAINQVISTVLAPLSSPSATPAAQAAQTPVLWGVLAWLKRTFTNVTPTLSYNPQQTSQNDDTITGRVVPVDADSDPVTLTASTSDVGAAVVINDDGTFTYTVPASMYEHGGTATITITATDADAAAHIHGLPGLLNLISSGLIGENGHSTAITLTIPVAPVNDAPVPGDPAYTVGEPDDQGTLEGGLHVSDPDDDTLVYTVQGGPADGSLVLRPDGTFTYTPPPEARHDAALENATVDQLTDEFTVIVDDQHGGVITVPVTVDIDPTNTAPAVTLTVSDPETDGTVHVTVIAGDQDGDPVTYLVVHDPDSGTLTPTADGFIYTPTDEARHNAARENATPDQLTDTFTVRVSDAHRGTDEGVASVTIGPANIAPVTVDDDVEATEDTSVSGNVLTNDTDADHDTLTATLGTGPAHGNVTLDADGSFTYAPAANYNGEDSFTYTVSDNHGGTNTGTVHITVNPVEDAPVANDDTIGTDEDTPISGNVLTNDADPDNGGTSLTVASHTNPEHGALVLNTDGSFTYTPAENFNGADSFTYTATDGTNTSNTATVHITINSVEDAPVVVLGEQVTDPQTGRVTVTVSASDPDGDPLTLTNTTPSHGTVDVVDNHDGTWTVTYDPTDAARLRAGQTPETETDSFVVAISDGHGEDVTVPVTGVAISPAYATAAAPISLGTGYPYYWAYAWGVAFSPDGSHAYVANHYFGVTVIDTASNTVTAKIPVGSSYGVAVSPDGSRVYLANADSNSISVLDTAANTVIDTDPITPGTQGIAVGSTPYQVAVSPDGSRVYVTNAGSNTVSVIDPATNTVIGDPIPVGVNPIGVAVADTPNGSRVYVTNYSDNTVSVIDPATNTVSTITVGSYPYGVAVSPDGSLAYVTNAGSRTVSVIDTATNTVVGDPIPVYGDSNFGVAVSPDGSLVYVTNHYAGASQQPAEAVSVISIA